MNKELLQQALDALLEYDYAKTDKADKLGGAAIYALRIAIAQPEQQPEMDLDFARAMCRSAGISLVSGDFIERFADFVSDWRKGDFELPKLAALDMRSCFDAWQKFDPELATTPEQTAQEGDAKDAERYRFLRSALTDIDSTLFIGVDGPDYQGRWALGGDEADKAIDEAVAAIKKGLL